MKGAELYPVMDGFRIIPEEPFEDGFMIAAKADRVLPHEPHRKPIQHTLRIRSPIDVVAEIHLNCIINRPASEIILNPVDCLGQQVGAAVNITYGVDSHTRGHRSWDRPWLMERTGSHRRSSS